MVDANFYVLSSFLLFLYKPSREAATAGVHDGSTFFFLDRRVKTQILAARETQGPEFFNLAQLLGTVLHQGLQLSQGLLNFRSGSWAEGVNRPSMVRDIEKRG